MYCKSCGTKIEGEVKFCQNCGTQTSKEEKSKLEYNTLSKNACLLIFGSFFFMMVNSVIGTAGVLVGFTMGIIAFFEIKKTKEKGRGLAIMSIVIGVIFLITLIVSMIFLYLPIFK